MDRGYQCEVNRDTWVSLVCLVFFVLDFWRINMYSQTGREILKANVALERALALVTKENRGEVSVRILTVIRNLNDNIAQKIWMDLYPDKPRNINKVAKEFCNVSQYRFIGRFDKFLRKSVSHFTPSEDGAERLMLKYYQYTLQLKKTMWERYGVEILNNIENFLLDTDEQTSDYYNKVAEQIKEIELTPQITGHDNYYVNKIKPFFVEQEIYYEITLEPANDKPNKFNRITAFTKHDILENYSVALKFVDCTIDVFGVCFPIKIICEWHVSIRPCEINNFARILGYDINIQRSHTEYRALMRYLTEEQVSLVEIIDFEENQYNQVKNEIAQTTRKKTSVIFELLDECRERSKCNEQGKNILRYLLHRMNNGFIRDQWPGYNDNQYADLYISAKCRPFDKNPYSFNPKGHLSTIHELSECIDTSGREGEIIARNLENNAFQNGKLFTPIEEMRNFGCDDEIINIIEAYNASLYRGFKPDAEIGVYKGNLFKKGHEREIVEIVKYLKKMSKISSPLGHCFCEMLVDELKELSGKDKLDEIEKEHILKGMFSYTKVFFVYGAAGTGKTTLVNHISNLLQGTNRLYLAKTNPAVENMKRKISNYDCKGKFHTIDKFISPYSNLNGQYDLVVVDECSTVKNKDILSVINRIGDATLVLVGDIYQIEAIGFGNWFNICKSVMPQACKCELTVAHRSSDENLKSLWASVRNMSDDNLVLEETVRNDYSHSIDNDIFVKRAEDEIILCLNYNGLYGLNNINKLLQLNNHNPAVNIGIWTFKSGDPILFNDSSRFDLLYNNLKGKIVSFSDKGSYVYFVVEVETLLLEEDIKACRGLDYFSDDGVKTIVGFEVYRRKPFASDEDSSGNEHILPFQIAYAVSIHKSQGLEYDSVKIVIADETEDRITHNIFYTAITRARKELTIYWSPEVCNRILARIRPNDSNRDYFLLESKNKM